MDKFLDKIKPWHIFFVVGIGLGAIVTESVINNYFETQRLIIQQNEETERTEERSQFWQKLVPWGKDEDEGDS